MIAVVFLTIFVLGTFVVAAGFHFYTKYQDAILNAQFYKEIAEFSLNTTAEDIIKQQNIIAKHVMDAESNNGSSTTQNQ